MIYKEIASIAHQRASLGSLPLCRLCKLSDFCFPQLSVSRGCDPSFSNLRDLALVMYIKQQNPKA